MLFLGRQKAFDDVAELAQELAPGSNPAEALPLRDPATGDADDPARALPMRDPATPEEADPDAPPLELAPHDIEDRLPAIPEGDEEGVDAMITEDWINELYDEKILVDDPDYIEAEIHRSLFT